MLICLIIYSPLFAQKDLPHPPSDFQTIPSGSYVLAMDTSYQKIVAPFNLKAYGLINQFLQNQFPVKWAIRAGKNLNDIDFSAQAERVFPSVTAPMMMDFRGGPFIIPDTSICGLTTQNIIQSFGNNVCVYRLIQSEVIDIRYTINNRPKVAIFTNGGNEQIHAKILTAAGISNYEFLDAANIANLKSCFTFASEPHWDFNNAMCFTDLSTLSSGSITSYQWSFGEPVAGTGDSSSSQNSCHLYSTSNTFNVSLTTISDQGCQSTFSKTVTVSPLPVIDFTPSWACLAIQTCFTNLSTIASGSITGYNWNFSEPVSGTTDTSSLKNPCYLFSNLNPVDVTLILTSNKGCSDTLNRNVNVSTVPVANFGSNIVCPGITTCFSDLSTIPAGSIVNWQWNFSDTASGLTDSSNSQNPCHTFLNTSSPNVSLTVTSNIGCQNTITTPVFFNPVPSADFSTTTPCLGNQTCFTDLTTLSSGSIQSRQWTFGEVSSGLANSSSLQNPAVPDLFSIHL